MVKKNIFFPEIFLKLNENVNFKEIWKNPNWDFTFVFQWDNIRLFCECPSEPQAYATNRLWLFSASPNWFWYARTHSITNIGYLVSVWNIYWKKYAITITDTPHWVHTYLATTRCSSNFCVWPLPISEISEVDIGCKNIGIITSSRRIYNPKKNTIPIWWRLFIGYELRGIPTFHWIQTRLFTSYGQSYIKLRAKMHEKSRYYCYRWKKLDHFQQSQFSLTFIIAHHLRFVVVQRGIWCGTFSKKAIFSYFSLK